MIVKPAATAATWGSKNETPAAPMVDSSSGHRRLTIVVPGASSGSVVCERAPASSRAIGGEVSARRPSAMPIVVASSHQPAATYTSTPSSSRAMPITVTVASSVAAPALSRTVALRKSPNRTAARSGEQRLQELADAVGALDHRVGLVGELGRA